MDKRETKHIEGFRTDWMLRPDGTGRVELYLTYDGSIPTVRIHAGTVLDCSGRTGPAEINCCATGSQSSEYMVDLAKALMVAVRIAEQLNLKKPCGSKIEKG